MQSLCNTDNTRAHQPVKQLRVRIFGGGGRVCVGERFAEAELVTQGQTNFHLTVTCNTNVTSIRVLLAVKTLIGTKTQVITTELRISASTEFGD